MVTVNRLGKGILGGRSKWERTRGKKKNEWVDNEEVLLKRSTRAGQLAAKKREFRVAEFHCTRVMKSYDQ